MSNPTKNMLFSSLTQITQLGNLKEKKNQLYLTGFLSPKMIPGFSNSPHITGKVLNQILKNFLQILVHLMKAKRMKLKM